MAATLGVCVMANLTAAAEPSATALPQKKLVAPAVSIVTDRVSALYSCGDKAVFTVTVTSAGQSATTGICTVKLTNDGGALIAEGQHDLAEKSPFTLEATLDKPGFIRCDFMGVTSWPHELRTRAAAGFDVERIRQGHPEPADFEAFWADALKRQRAVENAVSCEPLPDRVGKPGYNYFKLTVKTIDAGAVYGFLGIPAGKPGPFPGLVLIAGAGPGYDAPDPTFIRPDLITLSINIHAIDPTLPAAEFLKRYKELTAQKDYGLQGAPNRDTYYFRNAILGANAAVEWLAAQPQFNKKDLFYLGASQGGGFGLILAGLNHQFTALAVSVPALCDHGGIAADRAAGWPQLVKNVAAKDAVLRQPTLAMSGYFDAVNFARRVTCPTIFTVGYCDATCCPSSVYAAYNAMKAPKYMMTAPLADHPVPWEHLNGIWQWIQNSLDDQDRSYRAYFKY